jgi:hypothetical protein
MVKPILPGALSIAGQVLGPANIDVNVEGSVFSPHDGRQSYPDL